ncbi:uncharacterized protein LAJ45_08872 [Morchella importuna]|uniref:uncharacterized protein n=1 Tax=Morchella importuna TaxID=1174673 RepID=UPI001E8D65E3|nr:uncharacterized protein LAJ45_08872 [Morchella importuna]KAH8147073.1 hypothetical protein LAJ45_08872 [Morchella importuna]
MTSSAREIRTALRKEKMQRKKDAAEQAAIPSADKDVDMSDGKEPNDSPMNLLPLGVLPPIVTESPARTAIRAKKNKKKKAANKATDPSPPGANEGGQTGEKAEQSKAQRKRVRQQRREEWRAVLLRVAQKISGDDTLLDAVRDSYTSEGRNKLFNVVAALDPGAGRDSNLISELNGLCDRHTLEPLRLALQYRHDVKLLRDKTTERENAELLARLKESGSVEEYENKKLELEQKRRVGQRKFVQNESAAGRSRRDVKFLEMSRRERAKVQSRLMAKKKREELEAAEMDGISAIVGGLRFDAGGVDGDTGSGTAAASEVVDLEGMSLPDA